MTSLCLVKTKPRARVFSGALDELPESDDQSTDRNDFRVTGYFAQRMSNGSIGVWEKCLEFDGYGKPIKGRMMVGEITKLGEIKTRCPFEVKEVIEAAEACMKTPEAVLRLRSVRAFNARFMPDEF